MHREAAVAETCRLLGAFLNLVAGFFHVLAEAVGGVATHAADGNERGNK